jgi:inhibitor of cysteine peptidase
MKRHFLFIPFLGFLVIFLIFSGCKAKESDITNMPALHGGQEAQMIELTIDDFMASNHIVKDISLIRPGSLIVTLGANPTTGFEWADAVIDNSGIISQQSHVYVAPQSDNSAVGAPGKDVWVFDSLNSGSTAIHLSYSRPWEGGEKDQWTLTINVSAD